MRYETLSSMVISVSLALLAVGCEPPIASEADSNAQRPAARSEDVSRSTVFGVVKDSEGKPVPRATVLAMKGWRRDSGHTICRTDDQGRFCFPGLIDGVWFFSVDDTRYAKEWHHERGRGLTLPVDAGELEIQLSRPCRFTGQVVDDGGEPVPNANVTLVWEVLERTGRPAQGHFHDLRNVLTNSHGRFVFERLRSGTISFLLDHPDFARTLVEDVPLERSGETFTINKGLSLEGRAIYEGKPVPGVPIYAGVTALNARPMGAWFVTTDESGGFLIERIPDLSFLSQETQAVYLKVVGDTWASPRYTIMPSRAKEYPFAEVQIRQKEHEAEGPREVLIQTTEKNLDKSS